jgi:HTH-like domain
LTTDPLIPPHYTISLRILLLSSKACRPWEKKRWASSRKDRRHAVREDACQEKLPISIRHLCELGPRQSAWYYARQHVTEEPSKRIEAVALRDAIEAIMLEFSGYGYRRVTHALQRAGWKVNHKRVLRIMHEESGHGQFKRHARAHH